MSRLSKGVLQITMKTLNSIMVIIGISIIVYSLWMIRVWQRNISDGDDDDDDDSSLRSVVPWFIYSFVALGIIFCLIACFGHVAADTANAFCLSSYAVILFLLLILETAIAADIFLNSDWDEDLPDDPSGRFEDFVDFVDSNIGFFQCIGLAIVLSQGLLILVAIVLKTLKSEKSSGYASDQEHQAHRVHAGVPLLNHPILPPEYIVRGEPHFVYTNDSWNLRVPDKVDAPFKFK